MGLFSRGSSSRLQRIVNDAFGLSRRATSDFRRDFLDQMRTDLDNFTSQLQATGQSLLSDSRRNRESFVETQQGIVNRARSAFDTSNEAITKLDGAIAEGRSRDELQRSVEVSRLRQSLRDINPESIQFDDKVTTFFDLEGKEHRIDQVTEIPRLDLAKIRRTAFNTAREDMDALIAGEIASVEAARANDPLFTTSIDELKESGQGLGAVLEARAARRVTSRQQALVNLFGAEGVDYTTLFNAGLGRNIEDYISQQFIYSPGLEAERAVAFARAQENELQLRFSAAQSAEAQRIAKNAELLEIQGQLTDERSQLEDLLRRLGGTEEQAFGFAEVAAEGGDDIRTQIAKKGRSRKKTTPKPPTPTFGVDRPS